MKNTNGIPKNIKQLRDQLTDVFIQVRGNRITDDHANSLTKVAGKIISSCAVELKNMEVTGNRKRRIDYLHY